MSCPQPYPGWAPLLTQCLLLSPEEVRELLATLEGLDGEDWLPLELGEEGPEEQPEDEPAPRPAEELMAPAAGAPGRLEEEAALQLALHQSLRPQGLLSEQEEAVALQRALALSLLEPRPQEAEEVPGGATGQAQLLVHTAFEQDLDELDQALGAALERHLREETVGLRDHVLPAELRARLGRYHGVSVTLHSNRAVLRGFGDQPTRAARHLAALLAGPGDPSQPAVLAASSPAREAAAWDSREPRAPCVAGPWPSRASGLQQGPKAPLGQLECVAESSREFQEVVQAFEDTLDAAQGKVRVVRVSPRSVCGPTAS